MTTLAAVHRNNCKQALPGYFLWCLLNARLGRRFAAVLPGELAAGTDSLLFLQGFENCHIYKSPCTTNQHHNKHIHEICHFFFLLQVFLHWQVCWKSLDKLCSFVRTIEKYSLNRWNSPLVNLLQKFVKTQCFDAKPLYDLLETRNSLSVLHQHYYARYRSLHQRTLLRFGSSSR